MNMKDIEVLGGYCNAGHADIYFEGKHERLGDVSVDGDVHLSVRGQQFVNQVMVAQLSKIITAPDSAPGDEAPPPPPREVKAPRAKKATPPVPPVDLEVLTPADVGALDELLG